MYHMMREIDMKAALSVCIALAMATSTFAFIPKNATTNTVEIALETIERNNMPLVDARVNGQPCTMIFDTGTTHTTLDSEFVEKNFPNATLTPVAVMGDTNVAEAPKSFHVDTLSIGEAEYKYFSAMSVNLDHITKQVGRKIDGILGMNVILTRQVLMQVSQSKVIINPPAKDLEGFWKARRSVAKDPLEMVIIAELGGRKIPLLFDSASTWTILPEDLPLKIGGDIVVKPMVTDNVAPRIGADMLRNYDALFGVGYLALRPARNTGGSSL